MFETISIHYQRRLFSRRVFIMEQLVKVAYYIHCGKLFFIIP